MMGKAVKGNFVIMAPTREAAELSQHSQLQEESLKQVIDNKGKCAYPKCESSARKVNSSREVFKMPLQPAWRRRAQHNINKPVIIKSVKVKLHRHGVGNSIRAAVAAAPLVKIPFRYPANHCKATDAKKAVSSPCLSPAAPYKQKLQQQPNHAKILHRSSSYEPSSFALACKFNERGNNYEKLMLSLQSPLPNEHQFAVSACLWLSSLGDNTATSQLKVIANTPSLVNMLLAHAGFYSDCGIRAIMEDTYDKAYGLQFVSFWEQICSTSGEGDEEEQVVTLQHNSRVLLCECFPGKLTEREKGIQNGMGPELGHQSSAKCCAGCPVNPSKSDTEENGTSSVASSLMACAESKLWNRVETVAETLRNFSLEKANLNEMWNNQTLLRFLLIGVQSRFRTLPLISWDIISNISHAIETTKTEGIPASSGKGLRELKNMLVEKVSVTFMSNQDRFILLRCMETLCGLTTSENKQMVTVLKEGRFYQRLFSLLTLTRDSLLATSCLELVYAVSKLGKLFCDAIVQQRGAVATLMAYMTVKLGEEPHLGVRIDESAHLTAILIIRNISSCSQIGRRILKQFEARLVEYLSIYEESAFAVSEILYFLSMLDNA